MFDSRRPAAVKRTAVRRTAVRRAAGVMLLMVASLAILHGGGPFAAPGQAPATSLVGREVYIVRPGDTLWTIARRLHPTSDPRPEVDQFAQRLHRYDVQVGDHILLR